MDLLSHVNILQGTHSFREYSSGNTLPLVALPWGLHHWTFQTNAAPWTFHPTHRKLLGVRLTHQPSPWMRDYGNVLVTAFHGALNDDIVHQSSAFSLGESELSPDFLGTDLLRYGIRLEMSPTRRGALFSFRRKGDEALRVRLHFDDAHKVHGQAGERRVTGSSRNNHGGVLENFALHFCGDFSVEPASFELCKNGACWTFSHETAYVEFRLAASFIDVEIAEVSLTRELAGQSIEDIRRSGREEWNDLLGRILIETKDVDQARTFYSCLYRTLLFPRMLDEIDAAGHVVHYSPYDGQRHTGLLCTDNGFWDTHRTVYPLLALIYPDKLCAILTGWLNACRQAGWSPKWASPGLRDCMIGTHFDAVVADAVVKGVTDWDVESAYAYLWKDATVPSEDGRFGRRGLADYIRLGYVPTDSTPYSVSRTLDFAYDDFCIAQVAAYLGRATEEDMLRRRAQSYENVFDASVGFMRGRRSDGTWSGPFDEFTWGDPYVEGGPWQHVFNVQHDPEGLMDLFGGAEALCRKLDKMLSTPPLYKTGAYGYEIHEMTEMALAGFGQYAHSNQPVHNNLFLYALAGHPSKTSYWVRKVAEELYSPDYLPGDEDNGEMSAWYVFATLGLYPYCPGKPEYVQFAPLVTRAIISAPHLAKPLIRASGAAQDGGVIISHERLTTPARILEAAV